MIDVSIIVPSYNSEDYIQDCLESILSQNNIDITYEIIIIDDCSTDSTFSIIKEYEKEYAEKIRIYQTYRNSGPGIARNIGLRENKGKWILFLDSDDKLASNSLGILSKYFKKHYSNKHDLIGFNWEYDSDSTASSSKSGGRYDFDSLSKGKKELLRDSLSLGMDGSVIFTLFSNKLIRDNNILFSCTYHEDVAFIFKAYWCATSIIYLNEILYVKKNRKRSIVNSISCKHIEGYFKAYRDIEEFMKNEDDLLFEKLKESYHEGLIGVLATRIIAIHNNSLSIDGKRSLYKYLYKEWTCLYNILNVETVLKKFPTKYMKIAIRFIQVFSNNDSDCAVDLIDDFMNEIKDKSWSCFDLHNSIFLAPDEIRTCCKRFFVDNQMKGDVVLVDVNGKKSEDLLYRCILQKKKELYKEINRGKSNECTGCPFLEFKDWGYINEMNIKHLSFEYHTVCNMKCQYCSEKYYGGKNPSYDVFKLIKEFERNGCLKDSENIIWGGGEPLLDSSFESMIQFMAEKKPDIKQRVITNAIIYSAVVAYLLKKDKVVITTSIDAGTKDTFYKVRRSKKFDAVFENLKRYTSANPRNITIKYIILHDNSSYKELVAFSEMINKYKLSDCNFQISCDFNSEELDLDLTTSAALLYGLLLTQNCKLIFVDELLRQRIPVLSAQTVSSIKDKLKELGLRSVFASEDQYPEVAIWGAGIQTKVLIDKSYFFKKTKVKYIIDSADIKPGRKFMGYDVVGPDKLLKSEVPIIISAVQNSSVIYEQFISLGLDEQRLIKSLVI